MRTKGLMLAAVGGMLLMLAVAGNAQAQEWAKASGGDVPKSAHAVEKGVYAVKGDVQTYSGSATYPGVVVKGSDGAEIFTQASKTAVQDYHVYLPAARWCKGSATKAPKGAVVFGKDGGPLYFIRAKIDGNYCYGTFGAVIGAPYVYCGDMPQEAFSYEALCQ